MVKVGTHTPLKSHYFLDFPNKIEVKLKTYTILAITKSVYEILN